MYNAHKINYTYANVCYEHRPLNGVWIDGVNYDDEKNETAAELAALREKNVKHMETIVTYADELAALRAEVLGLQNDKEALREALQDACQMIVTYATTYPAIFDKADKRRFDKITRALDATS